MNSACATPCSATRDCDEAIATILTIQLTTKFIPTGICLSDLNIMSPKQKAGMVAKAVQDLTRDFETGQGLGASSIFDTLFTDAVFNGPGGNMTPVVLADTAAGYRQLTNMIATAKAKDNGSGVSFLVPPDLAGFIHSIPDRQIDRMLQGVKFTIMGNANAFAAKYGAPTYTGKVGFIYPTDVLAYAAPGLNSPNERLSGYAGNFWATMLDDTAIPGKMLYFAHQYGLRVVRQGDVGMLIAP